LTLDYSEKYPEKIKSLLEEIKFYKEKQIEQEDRIEAEEKNVRRQQEQVMNLESNKRDLLDKLDRKI